MANTLREQIPKIRRLINDEKSSWQEGRDPVEADGNLRYKDEDILMAANDAIADIVPEQPSNFERSTDYTLGIDNVYKLPEDYRQYIQFFLIGSGYIEVYQPSNINRDDTQTYMIEISPSPEERHFTFHNQPTSGTLKLIYLYQIPALLSIDTPFPFTDRILINAIVSKTAYNLSLQMNPDTATLDSVSRRDVNRYIAHGNQGASSGRIISSLESSGYYEAQMGRQFKL